MVHVFPYLIQLLYLAWVFPSLKMVLGFPCHFMDNHCVMWFILGWAMDYQKVLELCEVVSGKLPRVGGGDGFLQEALNEWVETENFLKVWWRNFDASKLGLVLWSQGRFNLWIPSLLCLGLWYEIPHWFLEYGTSVIGWNKYVVQPNLWSGGTWKSLTWLDFA